MDLTQPSRLVNNPTKVVVLSGVIMFGLTLAQAWRRPASFKQGEVYRRLFFTGVLTLGLAAAADFVPEVAAPFAILVVVAYIVRYPGAFGSIIGQEKHAAGKGGR